VNPLRSHDPQETQKTPKGACLPAVAVKPQGTARGRSGQQQGGAQIYISRRSGGSLCTLPNSITCRTPLLNAKIFCKA